MAQATNLYPSQNVGVWIQAESNVGAEPDDAGLTKLQATSFTIPEASVPAVFSSPKSGQFTQTQNMGRHEEGTKLWTFQTTLKGTPTSILTATGAVFESASSEAVLNNDYSFPHTLYVNNASSAKTYDIRFVNAGADSAVETIECAGCIGTGFTLSQDIGSENGDMVCVIDWATAFYPEHSGTDITSPAYDTATPKNIRELNSAATGINGGSLEELVIQSWELSVSRTIERVVYKDITSGTFAPFGYAMTGPFEVTGSLTCIRNNDVHDLLEKFRDSAVVDVNIQNSTAGELTIALDKCFINEPTVDTGGAVLMQTIPFTVVGANDVSSTTKMLGITIS